MPVSGLRHLMEQLRLSLRKLLPATKPYDQLTVQSKALGRPVLVDVYQLAKTKDQPVFYFLDGQDVRTMPITEIQQQLRQEGFPPFTIVGIHANGARMQEYGTLSRADYAGRGNRAPQTSEFILATLIPLLQKRYAFSNQAQHNFIAGFSLGALLAFDLAWHHPQQFGTAGVFSGALWWRSRPFLKKQPDANRILHTQVSNADQLPPVRYWFQAGTEDEQSDRNQNGIIDAIDDTLQLMKLLRKKGQAENDIHYHEVPNGRHDPATWSEALPHFLRWGLEMKVRDGK